MPAVLYQSKEGIATITLNRPEKRNAINTVAGAELADAWRRFAESNDRVAILTAAGEKAFCGGIDVTDVPEPTQFLPGIGTPLEKPVIAAVFGWCAGIGIPLVMLADLCVAGENTQFYYPEGKIGITGGIMAGLAGRIPHKCAMELMLLGRPVPARRAYEYGLVNAVVAQEKVMETALDWAAELASQAPLVHRTLKRFVERILPKSPSQMMAETRREIDAVMNSADAQEGLAAFAEKRAPKFEGR